ncbi:MAG: glycosyltransferase family 1 protein [Chitinophagaceae bacterium]|nr:glycosyltransferase family 1 protein [Chitinophagaceae bacterium]
MQNKKSLLKETSTGSRHSGGKKILFASFPADGHFNPLTGLAKHLQAAGHDVRWYTSPTYEHKLAKLKIPFFPFKNAVDVSNNDFDKAFPDRVKHKTQISRLKFDIINAFIKRGPEYYADVAEIYRQFPFDLLVADVAFTGIPFVKDLMRIPVISIGVFPLSETSKDLPPVGLGMTPSYSFFGKLKQTILRTVANKFIFGQPNKVMYKIFDENGIAHNEESLFDMGIRKSDLLLQSGTPGFEYYRGDLGENIRYIGALLPYSNAAETKTEPWFDSRLNEFEKVILVTQGTVEKDIEKILVPTLRAFKNTNILVVATTGGNGTNELKERFPDRNFIIEDFIPFADVMPYADVYITNGGYGGVMLGIENKMPMVVAGLHEGKNEICARVGYFKLGINLKTETPGPEKMRAAVEEIFCNDFYKTNVTALGKEFARYKPNRLFSQYVDELLYPGTAKIKTAIRQLSNN